MSTIYDWLHEKYKDSSPEKNPLTFQLTKEYKGPILGSKGKVYLKRGKMNDGIVHKHDHVYFAVPCVWEQPMGFEHDRYNCWITKSELHAMNQYRYSKLAQGHLKRKWDKIIERQDYMYKLSKAIDSGFDLPELKESFIPRDHQKVGVEFGILTNGRFIIADQQRTGKSYTSLMYVLSQKWDKCLIICPSKVVPIWANTKTGMISHICDLPINVLSSGDELEDGFNVVSYDTIHTIDDLDCDIAIADEAHFFLEVNARRSHAVNRIKADKKIALTGTPLMNSASDMLSILNWINPRLSAEMELFYAYMRNVDSYERARLIAKELKRRCLLLRETHQVGTTTEPYINFITVETPIENPKDLQEVGRAKVNYAVEYCNAFQDKILVAFYYKETGQMLKARLGSKAVLINGDSTPKEVEAAKEAFAGDTQILLGSTVLAEGLDFSYCNNILMVEESSYSMRTDQIRERCNNIYKQQEVTIDVLVVPGTQDDRLYDLLGNKFALSHGLRDA